MFCCHRLAIVVLVALGIALGCSDRPAVGAGAEEAPPETSAVAPVAAPAAQLRYELVRSYPHDRRAFTQGLTYRDGYLYEGTGRRGESSLRQVRVETGEVVRRVDLPSVYFGEGITILGDRVYQLTWLSGVGFVYDLESLQVVQQFRQVAEGWGLTHDGSSLIQSDGSDTLYFLDPSTMALRRRLQVRDERGAVDQINELEWVEGAIFANVWHSDEILRISPADGTVTGRIDLAGILPAAERRDPEAVLNGIACDPETGRLYVTGKLWPKLFEIRVLEP